MSLLLHAACTHLKQPQNNRSCLVSLYPVQEGPYGCQHVGCSNHAFIQLQSALCQSSKKPFVYYKMPQKYAKLSFMNSDHKEVTCICDTVHHVRLATGWTVRGSNPVGRNFLHLSRPAHPASCTIRTVSFPGAKSGRGVRLTPHPSSAVVKKK